MVEVLTREGYTGSGVVMIEVQALMLAMNGELEY